MGNRSSCKPCPRRYGTVRTHIDSQGRRVWRVTAPAYLDNIRIRCPAPRLPASPRRHPRSSRPCRIAPAAASRRAAGDTAGCEGDDPDPEPESLTAAPALFVQEVRS
jgi:hypothetical protein